MKSWAKIYNTWLIAGIITKRIHWTDSAGRDKTPSSIKAHGRIDQVYDILYETLGERVKHVSFIRTDDLELVVWRGRRPFWFDSRISRNLIEKTELLVENPDLASSKIIEIDKNGKITKITLAREKSGHYHRWFGEIRLIQIVHTSIEGKPTSFAIVWEGYINWFQDPTTNEEAKKLNENFIKNFKDPKYKDVLLISNFINCEVKTEDFTLKGFRIVVGVNPKFSLVKESYGTLVAKSKKDRVENKLYRFDEGILGENWETRLEKVKSLMFEQTSVWREYIKNYEASEGKRPTFFDVISQTTFDAHLTVIDGKIEGVINSADPPFLEEPPLAHTAQILILEKIEERLRNEGLNYEASKIHEKRIKIEKFLENEYKTFYNTIYKRFRKKLENINFEEELKGIEDVYQRVKRKSEIIANLKTEALEESGPVGFVALDKAKYNDLRAKAKMKVYGNKLKGIIPENEIEKICWEFISVPPPKGIEIEGLQRGDAYRHITMEAALALTSLDKNRAWQFTENKQALKDVSDKILNRRFKEIKWEELICHKNYFKKVITENKVKSKLKKLLGKTIEKACGMGTAALFIALFATTSFLGIRLGIEIYKKLPKDAKDVLNSGYGEIRVHILLSCVSFILLNIDDYQDFVNSLSRKTSEGTLKNTVKVLLQTFLGCIINGLLLAMLTEKKNNKVILADDIIPYIARTLFGNNAWIFEKIIWPIISNIIQIVANGGPIMYLAGITIGTTITQILNNIL